MGSTNFMPPFLRERRTRSHVQGRVQEIRGISLVFREMWGTTDVDRKASPTRPSLGDSPGERLSYSRPMVVGLNNGGHAFQCEGAEGIPDNGAEFRFVMRFSMQR